MEQNLEKEGSTCWLGLKQFKKCKISQNTRIMCILKCYILSGFTRKNKVLFAGLGNLNETEKMCLGKPFLIAEFLKDAVE